MSLELLLHLSMRAPIPALQVESLAANAGAGPDGTPQSKLSGMSGLMNSKMGKMLGRATMAASSAAKGSRQKLSRLGVNISEAVQQVDVPMLQQLQPLAEARVADLQAEAVNENTSRSKRVSQGGGARGYAVTLRPPALQQAVSLPMPRAAARVPAYFADVPCLMGFPALPPRPCPAGQDDQGDQGRGAGAPDPAQHPGFQVPTHDAHHQLPGRAISLCFFLFCPSQLLA